MKIERNHEQNSTLQTRILIVDDQSTGRKILEKIIQDVSPHLCVDCFADPREALDSIQQYIPDLILVDYKMPGMDGLEFTRKVRRTAGCQDVPLVIVTVIQDTVVRYQALEAGATDFLTRPLDAVECQARCRNLLHLRTQQKLLRDRSYWLENQVAMATTEIRQREQETLSLLARVAEYRDNETSCHIMRMGRYARMIAEGLELPADECARIELAAPLHDIGKIAIPDAILLKPGKLTPAEFDIMKTHAQIGQNILTGSHSPYTQLGAQIAGGHHEKYDGSGYPLGLQGEDIPLVARIVAIADVFDALASERPYKKAWSQEAIRSYFQEQTGQHFDPRCMQAFFAQYDQILHFQRMLCAHHDPD
ncbi:two-component system response regulator [Acidithiobacillus marinus]|uniref:Two-component system response regulator n=1 Tax=Acidithiobacillus marinus TaxID=187490 RepID=A0A2I1DJ94_9PROT|nr:HD domain-containing phosphohydrolase [Acidithiobacillus marinus]PKY09933.1 two-component system response regulator [Acidithiobacillus marinus]